MELLKSISSDCAYADCTKKNIPVEAEICPGCFRTLNRCVACGTGNRVFARYCRCCGGELSRMDFFWPCSGGSVERLSVNRFTPVAVPPDLKLSVSAQFKLPGRCRYILSDHGYIIAFSLDGGVKILDTARPGTPPFYFRLDGHLFAEPAIDRGTLYTGTGIPHENHGKITAWSLTRIHETPPVIGKLWDVPVDGIPTRPLLVFNDRLYYQLVFKDSSREIFTAAPVNGNRPPQVDRVTRGMRIGSFAADRNSNNVFFFSVHESSLHLNTISHPDDVPKNSFSNPAMPANNKKIPEMHTAPVQDAPRDLADHISPAVVNGKLLTVFRDGGKMGSIDSRHGRMERWLFDNVKQFAVESVNRAVIVDSSGVFFPGANHHDRFIPDENTTCPPVILGGKVAVMGMHDGKLRFYHLHNPSIQSESRVFDSTGDPVTAMAVCKNYIIVGNQRGIVKLLEMHRGTKNE